MHALLDRRSISLGVALFAASCSEPPPPNTAPPIEEPPPPPEAPAFAPTEPRLHRLTLAQYRNTVRDLLGPVEITTDLEVDTPLFGFTTIGAANLAISARAAEQFQASAKMLAQQIFTATEWRRSFLGCDPIAVNDPCIRVFIERFGRRSEE